MVSGMEPSPYTELEGDDVHGRRVVRKPCWVRLNALYVRPPDAPRHTLPEGLDLDGEVRGLLSGWHPNFLGGFLGVVTYQIPYADGRRNKLQVFDGLVPDYALRPDTEKR